MEQTFGQVNKGSMLKKIKHVIDHLNGTYSMTAIIINKIFIRFTKTRIVKEYTLQQRKVEANTIAER